MPPARDNAQTHPEPSRRALFAGGTAALLAAAVTTAAHSAPVETGADAELIKSLARFRQNSDAIAAIEAERLPPGITDASRDQERRLAEALDARIDTIESIIITPALTPAGMQGKAEALGLVVLQYPYEDEGVTLAEVAENGDDRNRLALSLARDVLAWRASA